MIQTVEAIVDDNGRVELLEPVRVRGRMRALVTILDEPAGALGEAALLAEQSLGVDWNRSEEDEAWAHLQSEQ